MKKLLPLIILLVAAAITALLTILTPEAEEVAPERPVTQVETLTVVPETLQLRVRSQGTVLPRTETDLVAEVSGRIIEVSDAFRAGGFFEAGAVLLRIDPSDYRAALAARKAERAEARLALAEEEARAAQAREDWEAIGEGEASPLTLREPQLARARAAVASAEAAVQQAERDLERTEIRAPYAGRVLRVEADLGQFVAASPTAPLARIFATDEAEVRLPLTRREVGYIDRPDSGQAPVKLFRNNRSDGQVWDGRLDRIEATMDPDSRLLFAVARIPDPFREKPGGRPALRRGEFLEADIEGRTVPGAFALPRYALRGSETVYIMTPADTLVTRRVSILKSDPGRIVVTGGLEAGERVVTSPIAYFVENMPAENIETP